MPDDDIVPRRPTTAEERRRRKEQDRLNALEPMDRRPFLDLVERYHALPAEMAELGALVRAAPDQAEAAWRAGRLLFAEYQNLWTALERDPVKRGTLYTALNRVFDHADPWAAFKAMLSPAWGDIDARRGVPPLLPAVPPRPPVRLLRNMLPGTNVPLWQEVRVPELDAVAGSPLDAEYYALVPLDAIYRRVDIDAAVAAARSAVVKQASGRHRDWELSLQLYAERRRHPDLTDWAFCAHIARGTIIIARWGDEPRDDHAVRDHLASALKIFGRLTPDTPLAELLDRV
jgi:hypothetical protein